MIHHLSIAARDPKHVAGVLAELMGGKAVPFPPNPGSFFALQLDEHGSGVEVYPAGTELQPGGSDGGGFVKKPEARGFGPTHFALSVATDADKVEAIAARQGWQCFRCNRGPFHVIEVWVENETMVEILPPEYAAEYLAFTRPDKVGAAMAAAAPQASRQRQAQFRVIAAALGAASANRGDDAFDITQHPRSVRPDLTVIAHDAEGVRRALETKRANRMRASKDQIRRRAIRGE